MPLYRYEAIPSDASTPQQFELSHGMAEGPLTVHPQLGISIRRVYEAPNLGTHHTAGRTQKLLNNTNLAQKGFTKYVKNKDGSGGYYKEVGEGPERIEKSWIKGLS